MVGQRVKELRNAANMTQQELSEGIISRTYLSLIEKNAVHPSTSVLKKLSERLNCTLDDFTVSASDRNLSLLDIKKEIKWAENHAVMNDFSNISDFIDKNYERLENITELERGSLYWVRASYAFYIKDYVKARDEVAKAIDIVHRMKDVTIYLRSLTLLARLEFEEGDVMKAIDQLTLANNITIFESVTNTLRVTILSLLGEYYRYIGENIVAVKLCEDALALNKKLHTHHCGLEIENTLSKAYQGLIEYDKALFHIERALKFAELNGPSFDYVGIITNMAILYMKMNKVEEAYDCIKKGLDAIDEYQYDHPFIPNVRIRYAQVLNLKGQPEMARELVLKELEDDPTGFANEVMGDLSVEEGNMQGAVVYYQEAIKGDDQGFYIGKVYKKLAQVYEQLNEPEKMIDCLKKSITEFERHIGDVV